MWTILSHLQPPSGTVSWKACRTFLQIYPRHLLICDMFSGELGQVTTSICTEMGVYFYASRSTSKVSSTDVLLLDLSPALLRGISIYILYLHIYLLIIDRVDKKRDKIERKILDSQERAFWDVHRPVVCQLMDLCKCLTFKVNMYKMGEVVSA